MTPTSRSPIETQDVYRALVADLALTTVPTTIMGITLVGIGLFAHAVMGSSATASAVVLAASVFGGVATIAKVGLMRWHRRRNARGDVGFPEAVRWEAGYAATTVAVAGSIGVLSTTLFRQSDLGLHLLSTGLMFGYGAGIVGRVSIRPAIAIPALVIAVVPPIAAAALSNDAPHSIIAAVFGVFLLGALESVFQIHRTAVKHIGTQLDMASLARNDPLTGLANRLGLREAFRALRNRGQAGVAIHYLDLDGFKSVNDRFGHAAGDALLAAIAGRLASLMPPEALAARVGGDEFVILQPVPAGEGDARGDSAGSLARRVDAGLREPFQVAGRTVTVGVSLGYALSRDPADELGALLARADAAAYRAKRSGGGVAAPDVQDGSPIVSVA